MAFYVQTITEVLRTIQDKFPGIKESNVLNKDQSNLPNYFVWMCNSVLKFNYSSWADALKAARWIGWILRAAEQDLRLWDNTKSRNLIRNDVELRFDRPRFTTNRHE